MKRNLLMMVSSPDNIIVVVSSSRSLTERRRHTMTLWGSEELKLSVESSFDQQ